MLVSVPLGCWHVIWCWQWPPVREKKREKDKGRRGLTTCWTRTRTVEVASRDWWRGRTHFRGVCTDMIQLQLLQFPLLSSWNIQKLRCDVGNVLPCIGNMSWSESKNVRLKCNSLFVPSALIGCKHSGASNKVRLFVKRLPCDWLKCSPVTALYWFKCLTFFFKGGGTRQRLLASGPVGYERNHYSGFYWLFLL